MLIDKTYNKFNIDFYLNNKEINCLAKIIHNVLYKSFPSLKILVIYLKNINTFLKKNKFEHHMTITRWVNNRTKIC